MCKQCAEFDNKISRCRRFLNQPFDALTIERIEGLIVEFEKQKAALNCKSPEL
jgi:hypothetical protein